MEEKVKKYNELLKGKTPQEVLKFFLEQYPGKVALGTSLGAEDQVLTDMIVKLNIGAKIFTLDTGRLFQETYDLLAETEKKYGIKIEVYFPDYKRVEEMVTEKGINLFYESVENRKLCCQIRKVEPSKRALKGVDVWVNGIRKDQTVSRFFTELVEWDEANELIKINPLLEWNEKKMWEYLKTNDVPYNKLHDQGFPSIGCKPCTRAVAPDEDVRAGRWWWEQPEHKECGLHTANDQ